MPTPDKDMLIQSMLSELHVGSAQASPPPEVIDTLWAELNLRRSQMSAFPFCPDHRDKVMREDCYACANERLRAQLAEARGTLISMQVNCGCDDDCANCARANNTLAKLDALAPAPPGSVLVSREDAERALDFAWEAGREHEVGDRAAFECMAWNAACRLLGLPVEEK